MPGPLSHVVVLDLSRVLAGPWCTQLLADYGAEVIKVERPGAGDDTRSWGPPFLADTDGRPTSDAAYFLACNRGKESVAIDFTRPEGSRLVQALAERSDVLVENYKVGGLAKYGLDFATLSARNPRLVYCSITGFGQNGPYAGRAGYDFIIQGMGGLMSVTGERDDLPGGGPQKVGVAVSDLMTGMYATTAIMAALTHRDRTGVGQHIDACLLDTQVAMLANLAANYLVSGEVPGRMGNAHQNIVPYQAFACSDGHLILAVGNDGQFARFCEVAHRADLATDPRYRSNADRVRNRDELVAVVAGIIRTRSQRDWITALEGVQVPCGPINRLDQVFDDPQVRHRGMRIEMPHPRAGSVELVGNPVTLGVTPVEYRRPPPLLGQHTVEVLESRLSLSRSAIEALATQGVVQIG
jgi:crotonobetainyl-CoA:carnitine CoA-transferase CaiB-like acyl-CoA transferase